jgi:hypothetical protein
MRWIRDRSSGGSGDGVPVERFKPTTGAFVGWTGIALAVLVIGYVALNEHSLSGLRLALGVAFGAVLVWSTQLRPRVTAYPRHLRLHGPVRDTFVPYLAINQVSMGQMLNVYVGRKRFVCVGIGRSIGYEMRQRVRSAQGQGGGGALGGNRSYQFAGRAETTEVRETGQTYAGFVLDRINELVAAARAGQEADGGHEAVPPVHRRFAVPEVVALVVLGAAFLASLLA